MTTVITRLYAEEKTARDIANRLIHEGISISALQVVKAEGRKRPALTEALKAAGVHASAVAGYADCLAAGGAAVVAKVNHKPLGAAKIVRNTTAKAATVALENVTEEYSCKDAPKMNDNIMKDHRHIFLNAPVKAGPAGEFSARFGWSLLKDTPRKPNLCPRDAAPKSAAFWPTPLVKDTPRKPNLCPRDAAPKSAAFWKAPLLKDSPRQSNVIPGDFLPFSNTFGLATISRRPGE